MPTAMTKEQRAEDSTQCEVPETDTEAERLIVVVREYGKTDTKWK